MNGSAGYGTDGGSSEIGGGASEADSGYGGGYYRGAGRGRGRGGRSGVEPEVVVGMPGMKTPGWQVRERRQQEQAREEFPALSAGGRASR